MNTLPCDPYLPTLNRMCSAQFSLLFPTNLKAHIESLIVIQTRLKLAIFL